MTSSSASGGGLGLDDGGFAGGFGDAASAGSATPARPAAEHRRFVGGADVSSGFSMCRPEGAANSGTDNGGGSAVGGSSNRSTCSQTLHAAAGCAALSLALAEREALICARATTAPRHVPNASSTCDQPQRN